MTEHYRALPKGMRMLYGFAVVAVEPTKHGNIIQTLGYTIGKTNAIESKKNLTSQYKNVRFIVVPTDNH